MDISDSDNEDINPTSQEIDQGSSSHGHNEGKRTEGEILSDFLPQVENYTPTIPDSVTLYCSNTAGIQTLDPPILRLMSIAAQKFISDVVNDALQHCKTRTNNAPNSSHSPNKGQNSLKDRKYTLTMEDLQPALTDYGITARRAHYFV